jgi:hypothetical protein
MALERDHVIVHTLYQVFCLEAFCALLPVAGGALFRLRRLQADGRDSSALKNLCQFLLLDPPTMSTDPMDLRQLQRRCVPLVIAALGNIDGGGPQPLQRLALALLGFVFEDPTADARLLEETLACLAAEDGGAGTIIRTAAARELASELAESLQGEQALESQARAAAAAKTLSLLLSRRLRKPSLAQEPFSQPLVPFSSPDTNSVRVTAAASVEWRCPVEELAVLFEPLSLAGPGAPAAASAVTFECLEALLAQSLQSLSRAADADTQQSTSAGEFPALLHVFLSCAAANAVWHVHRVLAPAAEEDSPTLTCRALNLQAELRRNFRDAPRGSTAQKTVTARSKKLSGDWRPSRLSEGLMVSADMHGAQEKLKVIVGDATVRGRYVLVSSLKLLRMLANLSAEARGFVQSSLGEIDACCVRSQATVAADGDAHDKLQRYLVAPTPCATARCTAYLPAQLTNLDRIRGNAASTLIRDWEEFRDEHRLAESQQSADSSVGPSA